MPMTRPGLSGGTAISRVFLANVAGLVALPARTTVSIVCRLAAAKTSAGAPWLIWRARPELGPKPNLTRTPGWAASNLLPISENDSISEAAASTVTVPVDAGEGHAVPAGPPPDAPPLEPQQASRAAASA